PNMTFPFGTYLVVVDIDRGTGQVKVRRMVAVDDCGVRINPMIVEGQIHGGLAEGFGIAFMELITFDEEGNCLGSNFTDYLLPTRSLSERWSCASAARRSSSQPSSGSSPPHRLGPATRRSSPPMASSGAGWAAAVPKPWCGEKLSSPSVMGSRALSRSRPIRRL